MLAELVEVTRVRLEVWDDNQNIVKTKDDIAPTDSDIWYIWDWLHPGELAPGSYTGVWIVDGDADAAVQFQVRSESQK